MITNSFQKMIKFLWLSTAEILNNAVENEYVNMITRGRN